MFLGSSGNNISIPMTDDKFAIFLPRGVSEYETRKGLSLIMVLDSQFSCSSRFSFSEMVLELMEFFSIVLILLKPMPSFMDSARRIRISFSPMSPL